MASVEICNDLEKAKGFWQRHWPCKCLFDLWPVRVCFQNQYGHRPHFLIASQGTRFRGMLALSWIDDENSYGHFPGEVWQGKTWLEQNRIIAADPGAANVLLDNIPSGTLIRYLLSDDRLDIQPWTTVDETGYLFFPGQYQYSFKDYWRTFSGKTRKKTRREIERLTAHGLEIRHDRAADIDSMFQLNLDRFQDRSYFHDDRFLNAFDRLASWLQANGLLRVTTVLIGGRVAAVDMAAIWNGTYTLLAGGTHADFPGVAKLINLHHMEWACTQQLTVVDFLCGEFNWKDRFHLTPRRLYQICRPHIVETRHTDRLWRRIPSRAF